MGQKDKLLEAAKHSLLTRGYAATTARELATDAGVSLAAIGYHFGSKDALLDLALADVLEDWAAAVMSAVADPKDSRDVLDQLATGWRHAIDDFEHYAPLLSAFIDSALRSSGSAATRQRIAAHLATNRAQVQQVIQALVPHLAPEDAAVAASFALAVVDGLFLQWLADPDAVPDGEAFVASLVRVLTAMTPRPRQS